MQTNQNDESTDKYVRLTGPATISTDEAGRITILCQDKTLNPKGVPLVFAKSEVMLKDVDVIIEFSNERFNFYQEEEGFDFGQEEGQPKFSGRLVEVTPETEALMNPSHP